MKQCTKNYYSHCTTIIHLCAVLSTLPVWPIVQEAVMYFKAVLVASNYN